MIAKLKFSISEFFVREHILCHTLMNFNVVRTVIHENRLGSRCSHKITKFWWEYIRKTIKHRFCQLQQISNWSVDLSSYAVQSAGCIIVHKTTLRLPSINNQMTDERNQAKVVTFRELNIALVQIELLIKMILIMLLTHWSQVTHMRIIKHHWSRHWLVAWTAPSHFMKQCWNIVNWTLINKFQWHNRNSLIFIQEKKTLENVVSQNGGHFVSVWVV